MDRIRRTATRTAHPVDNVHPVSRTSRYHFAHMRCAEDAAHSLSVQYQTRRFTAAFDPDTTPDSRAKLAKRAAVRDSYYMLAAAHRQAGRRRERAERRAAAWAGFRSHPTAYTRAIIRDAVRSIIRQVNV